MGKLPFLDSLSIVFETLLTVGVDALLSALFKFFLLYVQHCNILKGKMRGLVSSITHLLLHECQFFFR